MLHMYRLTEFSHRLDERRKTERGNSHRQRTGELCFATGERDFS